MSRYRFLSLVLVLAAVVLAVVLAGCGSTRHTAPRVVRPACLPNKSFMGCTASAVPAKFGAQRPAPAAGHVCLFPDVSVWQGHPGWSSVAAWQRARGCSTAAIFKLGEYSLDVDAAYNAASTSALHFQFRAGYWFIRNTGCSHESSLIIWAANRYGVKIVALDSEVPEARGYVGCLTSPLRRAGLSVVTYTSPGTWTGGDHAGTGLWQAEYGSRLHPLWSPTVAWQCTDGHYGCVTYIPGIGRDDVSIDLGITRLAPQPKPKPTVPSDYKVLTHDELTLVRLYDAARKSPKTHVSELKNAQKGLAKLAHVVWGATHHAPPKVPSWAYRNRGERFQALYRRSLGQRLA